MNKIRITEDELKQIINESVKKVLNEGSFSNITGATNAAVKRLRQNKGSGFGARLMDTLDASNKGYQQKNIKGLVDKLIPAIKNAVRANILSYEAGTEYIGYLELLNTEILGNVSNQDEYDY